jgi:hypothetical protein
MHVLEEWLDDVIFSSPWDRVGHFWNGREHPIRTVIELLQEA